MAALVFIVLALAISRMALLNRSLETITEYGNREIAHATAMRLYSSENSISFRNLIIDTDPHSLEADFDKLNKGLGLFESEAEALRQQIGSSGDPSAGDQKALAMVLERYGAIRPLLLEMATLGRDNKKAEAVALNRDKVHAINAAMRSALDDLVAIVEQQGQNSAAEAATAYRSGRNILIGLASRLSWGRSSPHSWSCAASWVSWAASHRRWLWLREKSPREISRVRFRFERPIATACTQRSGKCRWICADA